MSINSKLKTIIFDELSNGLSPQLYFHSVAHTRDDVLPAAESLAQQMGVTGEHLLLLNTAALFHDVGYLERYENNEPLAAARTREILPVYNYQPEQIEIIARLIEKTAMPQRPETLLEQIMCDADMDSLGRKDFWALSTKLCEELAFYRQRVEPGDWLCQQLVFLESHNYFTQAARQLRNAGKMENVRKLRAMIATLSKS
jgi:predicted metal-dependent HD superfamily phosphohydrolase